MDGGLFAPRIGDAGELGAEKSLGVIVACDVEFVSALDAQDLSD